MEEQHCLKTLHPAENNFLSAFVGQVLSFKATTACKARIQTEAGGFGVQPESAGGIQCFTIIIFDKVSWLEICDKDVINSLR